MFSVTRGSKSEIWQEIGGMSFDEAVEQGKNWSEDYPEQEIVVYKYVGGYEDPQPVWAMMNGKKVLD